MPHTPGDDVPLFLDHARWLLEWHNKRSEAFSTRATALLGFVGVMLALLVQGAALRGLALTDGDWWLVGTAGVLLGVSIGASLACLFAKTVTMPNVQQFRHQWDSYADAPGESNASSLVEALLDGARLTEPSPLSVAKAEADSRAKWFKVASVTLALGLVPLAALAGDLMHSAHGGR